MKKYLCFLGLISFLEAVVAENCTGAATFQYHHPQNLYQLLNGSSSASFLYYSESGAMLRFLALGDYVTKISAVSSNSQQEYQANKFITIDSGYSFPECFNVTVEINPEYANPSATGNRVGVSLTDFAGNLDFTNDHITCFSVYSLRPNYRRTFSSSSELLNLSQNTYKYFYYSAFKGEHFAFIASSEKYGGGAEKMEIYVSRAFITQMPSPQDFESREVGGNSVTIVTNATEDECYVFAVTAEKSTYFDITFQGANPSICNVLNPRIQDNYNGSVTITDSATTGTYKYFYYFSENNNLRIALDGNAELYVSGGDFNIFPTNTTASYKSNSDLGNFVDISYAKELCFSIGVLALDDSEFTLEINVDPKRPSPKNNLLVILLPIGIVVAAVALCLYVWRVQNRKKRNDLLIATSPVKGTKIEDEPL